MRHTILTTLTVAIAIVSGSLFIDPAYSADEFVAEQQEDQWLASNFIGTSVKNIAGESVGDINDLVFNADNDVDAALIGVGGFLGIGEKNVAVTFSSLKIKRDGDGNRIVVINLDKTALEAAPEYKSLANPNGSTTAQIKEKAAEWGEKTKDAAERVSEQAKKTYEDAKKSMTDENGTSEYKSN